MNIAEYTDYHEEEILHLYASVGWTRYTANPALLEEAYHHSLIIYGAYEDDKLVGVIRTVGDGVSIVFIQDIIVLPEYQRKGIGKLLMETVLQRFSSVYQMELMTDNTPKTIAFYQSLGFRNADELGCCAFLKM